MCDQDPSIDLVSVGHPIQKRVVAWGPAAEPITLPHSVVRTTEAATLIAVGEMPGPLLGQSRIIADLIGALEGPAAELPAYPRIAGIRTFARMRRFGHPGFAVPLTSLAKPTFAPWTGAPRSPKRTWAEKDGRSPTTASLPIPRARRVR